METAVITVPQKIQLGPAMEALNDRQRAFVVALNNAGGKNATEACRAAGYKDSGGSAIRVTANWLLHNAKVQAAIIEDCRARLVGDLPETLSRIDEIARDPQHKKQFDALKMKLHHAGMVETTHQQIDINVSMNFEQKVERIKQLCMQTGEDPAKYLGNLGVVTDAQFETVEEISPEEPEVW